MKKRYLNFLFLIIYTTILVGCTDNTNENIYNLETEKYAIYTSNIIESNPTEMNNYVHYERNINIQFPQIYYSNEYSGYDIDLETQINKILFDISIENNDSFLVGRDTREITEYYSDYTITKYDENIFSIKYYGHLYSISHAREFCYGVTIDANTGEMNQISDFISVDGELIKNIENGSITYDSHPMYEKDFVIEAASKFIEGYDTLENKTNIFFIDENTVYLIIPVSYGNSNYIILDIPL